MSAAVTDKPSLSLALLNRTLADRNLRDALDMHFEPGRSPAARFWSRGVVREAVVECRWARAKAGDVWTDYCAEHAESVPEDVRYINLRSAPVAVDPKPELYKMRVGQFALTAATWAFFALAAAGWVQHLCTAFSTGRPALLVLDVFALPAAIGHGWGVWAGWW